jgi:hypothetical protein
METHCVFFWETQTSCFKLLIWYKTCLLKTVVCFKKPREFWINFSLTQRDIFHGIWYSNVFRYDLYPYIDTAYRLQYYTAICWNKFWVVAQSYPIWNIHTYAHKFHNESWIIMSSAHTRTHTHSWIRGQSGDNCIINDIICMQNQNPHHGVCKC